MKWKRPTRSRWRRAGIDVSSAVSEGGPDYAAFKSGWWHLTHDLAEIREPIEREAGSARQPESCGEDDAVTAS